MRRSKRNRHSEAESSNNSDSSCSSHSDCPGRARKVKYIRVEVSRRETAKGLESSHRTPTHPPKAVEGIRVDVSRKTAAKGSDISDSSRTPPPRSAKDVGVAVSRTKASKGWDGSDRNSTPTPTEAEDVGVGVSVAKSSEGSDSSDRSSTPPPRKVQEVAVGASKRGATKDSNSCDRNTTASPGDSEDDTVEVPGAKAEATTVNMASMKVATPNVQISVDRPHLSLWSRLWNALSKASQVTRREGAVEGPKAPTTVSTVPFVTSVSLPECQSTEQGSLALQQECDYSKSSEESDVPRIISKADTQGPMVKRRSAITTSASKNQCESNSPCNKRQRTVTNIDSEEESLRQAGLFTPQAESKSAAIARIAVNSYKQYKCRSYAVCQHLIEATNDIGLSIFCSYPEDESLCLSVYGLSFIIALTESHVKHTKASLKETLRCGAMVPKEDGRMAYSCKEVVTTLRRRLAESDEVSVITEAYLRHSTTVNQQVGYGIASSTKNIASHLLTAEFEASLGDQTQGVWNEVLFNTACFENLWRSPFNKQSTYVGGFLNNWKDKVTVPMMRRTSLLPYSFYPDRQVDVVCLPYVDGSVCMTLIVQRSPSSGGLSVLSPDDVKGFVHGARNALLTLHLPKFRVSTHVDVADLITQIAGADSEERWMRFLQARLETSIAVNEGKWPMSSTESTASEEDPVTVVVDRPFHFIITDRTYDLVLYVGRVTSL